MDIETHGLGSSIVNRWRNAILISDATIEQAVRNLDYVALKIILVVNTKGEFEGTISDGDIRRGLLNGLTFNSPIKGIVQNNALVVPPSVSRDLVLQLMVANKIQQVPIVNQFRQVVGLHVWDDIATVPRRSNTVIIMAGGEGKRLRPHTENCPKPLLPVAGKPMLEHIIERAKLEGFSHFVLAVRYL